MKKKTPDTKQTRKMKKSPFAPKRFKSAYMFFSTAKHKEIRSQSDKKMLTTQIAKMVSEEWKSLTAEERAKWEEVARQDKIRYNAQKNAYRGPWKVPADAFRAKPLDAPRRPLSAILAFSNEKRGELKRSHPHWDNAEIAAQLSCMWKSLTDSDRQIYIDREKRLRQTYKEEMVLWKKKLQIEREMLQSVELSNDDSEQDFYPWSEHEIEKSLERISPDLFGADDDGDDDDVSVDDEIGHVSLGDMFSTNFSENKPGGALNLELEMERGRTDDVEMSEKGWSADRDEQKHLLSIIPRHSGSASLPEKNDLFQGCPSTPISSTRQAIIIPMVSPTSSKDSADPVGDSPSWSSITGVQAVLNQGKNINLVNREEKSVKVDDTCELRPLLQKPSPLEQGELVAASLKPIRISEQGEITFPEQKTLQCVREATHKSNTSSHPQEMIDTAGIHNFRCGAPEPYLSTNAASGLYSQRGGATRKMTSSSSMPWTPYPYYPQYNSYGQIISFNANPSASPFCSTYVHRTNLLPDR